MTEYYEALSSLSMLHIASDFIHKSEFDTCIGEVPNSIIVDNADAENECGIVLHIRTICDNIFRISKKELAPDDAYDYMYVVEQLVKDTDVNRENTTEYETIYTKQFISYKSK